MITRVLKKNHIEGVAVFNENGEAKMETVTVDVYGTARTPSTFLKREYFKHNPEMKNKDVAFLVNKISTLFEKYQMEEETFMKNAKFVGVAGGEEQATEVEDN